MIVIYYFFICACSTILRDQVSPLSCNKLNDDEDTHDPEQTANDFIRIQVGLSESSGLVGSLGRRAI